MPAIQISDIRNVVFVGCGGTNGYLIPKVCRMIAHLPRVVNNVKIAFVDPDTVESKNILRQNFIPGDIGKYKVDVLAKRYGNLYGLDVVSYPVKFDDIFAKSNNFYYGSLIVEAVDNKITRVNLCNAIRYNNHNITLSLGNTDKEGQAILTSRQYGLLRNIVNVFPEDFTEEKLKEEEETLNRPNCALNAVNNPQNVAINETAADVASNMLYEIFYEHKIDYDIVFFDRFNSRKVIKCGENPFVNATEGANLASLLQSKAKQSGM